MNLALEPLAGSSVLVVDDDPFSQDIFREMLESFGVTKVHTAENGRHGLRELREMHRSPDYLICDIFMPDMDGIEFLNRLSNLNFLGNVILVSAGNTAILTIARDVALAAGLKLIGVFPKPLQIQTLARVMGEVFAPVLGTKG